MSQLRETVFGRLSYPTWAVVLVQALDWFGRWKDATEMIDFVSQSAWIVWDVLTSRTILFLAVLWLVVLAIIPDHWRDVIASKWHGWRGAGPEDNVQDHTRFPRGINVTWGFADVEPLGETNRVRLQLRVFNGTSLTLGVGPNPEGIMLFQDHVIPRSVLKHHAGTYLVPPSESTTFDLEQPFVPKDYLQVLGCLKTQESVTLTFNTFRIPISATKPNGNQEISGLLPFNENGITLSKGVRVGRLVSNEVRMGRKAGIGT